MESAWLWTAALGVSWLDVRTDSSPLSISISLGRLPLLLCTLRQYFSIPLWGAQQPYSWLHFPSLQPACLSLLFLDSLDIKWFCQHAELQWLRGTGRWDAWLAAARFLLSEHYPSLMS